MRTHGKTLGKTVGSLAALVAIGVLAAPSRAGNPGAARLAAPQHPAAPHAIQIQQPAANAPFKRFRTPRQSPPVPALISPVWRTMPNSGPLATSPRPLVPPSASWLYQLTGISANAITNCRVDLAVIDYSSDGKQANAFTRAQVDAMRKKPGGGETKIVSYMSIGEAESYRDMYWKASWKNNPPSWLGPANDEGWGNNYRVRYWEPEWQKIIFGTPDSYVDRLIAAGFDGTYLDIVDSYEFWQDTSKNPDGGRAAAADEMIEFISRMARYAWSKNPNFYIIPQNGQGLLESEVFRAHISAVGMEDIFYTWANPLSNANGDRAKPQKPSETAEKLDHLAKAQRERIPIFAVEYLMDQDDDRRLVQVTAERMRAANLVPYFGQRQLENLHCTHPAKHSEKKFAICFTGKFTTP